MAGINFTVPFVQAIYIKTGDRLSTIKKCDRSFF
jgi:hypothetical protein